MHGINNIFYGLFSTGLPGFIFAFADAAWATKISIHRATIWTKCVTGYSKCPLFNAAAIVYLCQAEMVKLIFMEEKIECSVHLKLINTMHECFQPFIVTN